VAKSLGDAEQGHCPVGVAGVVAVGGGDVGGAGEAEGADGGVAECSHDVWAVAGADLGSVFVVGDVAIIGVLTGRSCRHSVQASQST
jgi:hypothetical protein